MSRATAPGPGTAARVVVSYPADLSDWGRRQVDTRHFRTYLLKTMGEVEEGDEWAEFVDVGCCGSALDVPLRVEEVQGGNRVTLDTDLGYTVREACGIEGGWRVQSADGPTT